ncbi:MAG: hypothetical protein JSW71_12370 [Gemmatimonadota bacterium]|nr:MAG: hypothetical protein JSW71_12370 [Gemmatimonadota bacterium]
MQWIQRHRRWSITGLAAAALGIGGCTEYRIETTLRADGSGVRSEKMVVEPFEDEADNARFRANFGYLMFATEDFRWTHREEVDDEDTVHVFLRETRITDHDSWADLSGTVHIRGAAATDADSTVGSVRLGDVHFRNRVRLERGRVTEGISFTYRETFYWENLADVLVEYIVREYTSAVVARYPDLNSAQRGELDGLVTGAVWFAVGQGLFEASGDEESELVSALGRSTAVRAAEIVQRRYPDATSGFFADVLEEVYSDDDRSEDFIQRQLPGVQLAINSGIVFQLSMPGRVLSSNAHDRYGATLIWEFVPGDALTAPLEIHAESIVER